MLLAMVIEEQMYQISSNKTFSSNFGPPTLHSPVEGTVDFGDPSAILLPLFGTVPRPTKASWRFRIGNRRNGFL